MLALIAGGAALVACGVARRQALPRARRRAARYARAPRAAFEGIAEIDGEDSGSEEVGWQGVDTPPAGPFTLADGTRAIEATPVI